MVLYKSRNGLCSKSPNISFLRFHLFTYPRFSGSAVVEMGRLFSYIKEKVSMRNFLFPGIKTLCASF